MAGYIRGPDVSYTGLIANPDRYNAIGFFDFVMPSDWDNTSSGTPLFIDILGGVLASGLPPTTFDVFPSWGIWTVNGGSALTATLSGSGDSYAIGSVVKENYNIGGDPSWTSIGLGQTITNGFMDPTALSDHAATLVDGIGQGYPGEGFLIGGATDGPVGWYPNPGRSSFNDGTAQSLLTAGQTVTFWIDLFAESTDSVNPDRSVFGVIERITLRYRAGIFPIDLSTVKVGWSAGASYVPYLSPTGAQPRQYPNPLRAIQTTPPPIGHPNQQTFIDLYRVNPPRAFCPAGVYFDGATYYGRASLIAIDSKTWSSSFWFKVNLADHQGSSGGSYFVGDPTGLYQNATASNPTFSSAVDCSITAGPEAPFPPGPGSSLKSFHDTPDPWIDGQWHHCLMSVDVTGDPVHAAILIDGSATGTSITNTLGAGPANILWNALGFHMGSDGLNDGTNWLKASVAEFWLDTNTSLLNGSGTIAPTNLAKFYDGSCPVDLGADGSTPTGTSPTVYCRRGPADPAADFMINRGTGGAFSLLAGALMAAPGPCLCSGGQHSQGYVF